MKRFWDKVDVGLDDECWNWTAFKRAGYGRFRFNGKSLLAHRMAWLLMNGEIPDGMVVMHSCDNPSCCNLKHLSLGTQKENVEDMAMKKRHGCQKKTHCNHGHEFSLQNTGIQKTKKNGIQRYCKECKKIQKRNWHRDARATRGGVISSL